MVTGSRHWFDVDQVYRWINTARKIIGKRMIVAVGDCPSGVDWIARAWCSENRVHAHVFVADWERYAKAAAQIRATALAGIPNASLGLAFLLQGAPCHGTWNTIRQLQANDVPTLLITEKSRQNW